MHIARCPSVINHNYLRIADEDEEVLSHCDSSCVCLTVQRYLRNLWMNVREVLGLIDLGIRNNLLT